MTVPREPLWYKDAIIYQTHVRVFADSASDGIGDFRGLTSRLDYIQDLGVTALWLLPFYPSPLRDDGYDIANYCDVNPIYGRMADFREFLAEAHARGLKVITELVMNHTSDQHEWFQRARRAPAGSRERDFYVWSDSADRYREARIIFQDFESSNWTWDAVAGAYYWHRFYSHQPDLNFENPDVHRAMLDVVDFWFAMGVDGLRLDAVPYLYEQEGTSCENLVETHGFLKKLRAHVDADRADRLLLAEANQWPEDAAAYFGQADECHMAFHFPLMPRLFMAVRQEDRYPIVDILQQTPTIPESCQWTIFLRNHDELTLEMVTDEERDYMYRVYARDPQARINLGIRRRLAPLLGNNRRKIELMNGLLMSLPGTPVIYYGDELGMGDNIYLGDRDSVRTPMQWSNDRNAGFSRANPQKLYLPVVADPEFHYATINVETQQNSPHSLLWWMKRLIGLRKQFKAFSRGSLEFLMPENAKVLAFLRQFESERILVVANLSRFVQCVELDLSAFKGSAPIEAFGQTRFPTIGDAPYFLTLGPHAFYWFCLDCGPANTVDDGARRRPVCRVNESWDELFHGRATAQCAAGLPSFLPRQRWFGGKTRAIQAIEILDSVDLRASVTDPPCQLLVVSVQYAEGEPEAYLLPVGLAAGDAADELNARTPDRILVDVESRATSGVLYDISQEPSFWDVLHELVAQRRRIETSAGELTAWQSREYQRLRGDTVEEHRTQVLRAEQSNSAAVIGDRFLMKLFRKTEAGVNPELEITQVLTDELHFPHVPSLAGAIEYQTPDGEPMTVAILHERLGNVQQAWQFTLNEIGRYYECVGSEFSTVDPTTDLRGDARWRDWLEREPSPLAKQTIASFLPMAALIGQRTGEMHVALANVPDHTSFAPEPFTPFYQRSLFQSMRNHAGRVLRTLRRQMPFLPESVRDDASAVLAKEAEILGRFRRIVERKISALRIRCHGDYHLGQVLYTGKDFAIIDFEGEPMRSISERRIKRSPLRDVAGMIRSFHYAAYAGLMGRTPGVVIRTEDSAQLARWANFWYQWTSIVFLKAYLHQVAEAPFVPRAPDELECLLDTFLLEKSLYETHYELNNRPDWIGLPLRGVLNVLEMSELRQS